MRPPFQLLFFFALVNVARNKSVIMSSQWKDYTSSANAVDGNTDPNVKGGSCAVTSAQKNPWLRIDLNEPTKVRTNFMSF